MQKFRYHFVALQLNIIKLIGCSLYEVNSLARAYSNNINIFFSCIFISL